MHEEELGLVDHKLGVRCGAVEVADVLNLTNEFIGPSHQGLRLASLKVMGNPIVQVVGRRSKDLRSGDTCSNLLFSPLRGRAIFLRGLRPLRVRRVQAKLE